MVVLSLTAASGGNRESEKGQEHRDMRTVSNCEHSDNAIVVKAWCNQALKLQRL
ncbi:MAG: hypothetical protein K5917_05660 [Clostridiales bacterium]|nr:hypothetical protein [Clostridiales bacterium]